MRYAGALSLEELQISDFSLAISEGAVAFGKDISVSDANIGISASGINRVEASGNTFVFHKTMQSLPPTENSMQGSTIDRLLKLTLLSAVLLTDCLAVAMRK